MLTWTIVPRLGKQRLNDIIFIYSNIKNNFALDSKSPAVY